MGACVGPFWPGCLQGRLCQSPAVEPGSTTLCFPLFLVADFPGAALTKALCTSMCCSISHHVIRMGTEVSPGSGFGCRRGEGGGQRSTPCTQDKYPCG